MGWARYGHAQVDPSSPRAWGTCDQCGFNYNLENLRWQFQYNGTGLYNKRFLVCDPCYDKPAQFLLTPILPQDPKPVLNARPEPYALDENNVLTTQGGSPLLTEDRENYLIPDNSVNDSDEPAP